MQKESLIWFQTVSLTTRWKTWWAPILPIPEQPIFFFTALGLCPLSIFIKLLFWTPWNKRINNKTINTGIAINTEYKSAVMPSLEEEMQCHILGFGLCFKSSALIWTISCQNRRMTIGLSQWNRGLSFGETFFFLGETFLVKKDQKREQKWKNENSAKPYKTSKPLQNNGLKVIEANWKPF